MVARRRRLNLDHVGAEVGERQLARELMADDCLRQTAGVNHRVEIDACRDAHLRPEQGQFLGADVAGRPWLPCKPCRR